MNYYAVERSTDHLAHYGVTGMRWGVRRAITTGNQRALDRHYRKAAKKLAKLQNIGDHAYKSAAKAAGYGAAAAATGAVAIGGTGTLAKGVRLLRKGYRGTKKLITGKEARPLESMNRAADAIEKWGRGRSIDNKVSDVRGKLIDAYSENGNKANKAVNAVKNKSKFSNSVLVRHKGQNSTIRMTNSDYARIGAAALTAGLAARAAQHAYRARNSEKYREKAERFRDEMDKAFAGTDYEGSYTKMSRRQQKRRRGYY